MRYLLSLAIILLLSNCYAPQRDCAKFKTGTFEFEAVVGTEILKTTFVRDDSLEIDYFKGKADTSSIRWINDCEYVVKKINPKNQAERRAIHMKILTTQNDTYVFEYNIVGEKKKQKGKAVKVKKDPNFDPKKQ